VARQRVEQLRAMIHSAPLRIDAPVNPITLSWGIAAFPQHGCTPADLLAQADQALYQAKSTGRDRVVVAQYAQHHGDEHGTT
jgi:diguanylate cyclase (GGDEF)-like protein